jgi:hypothetical protein
MKLRSSKGGPCRRDENRESHKRASAIRADIRRSRYPGRAGEIPDALYTARFCLVSFTELECG